MARPRLLKGFAHDIAESIAVREFLREGGKLSLLWKGEWLKVEPALKAEGLGRWLEEWLTKRGFRPEEVEVAVEGTMRKGRLSTHYTVRVEIRYGEKRYSWESRGGWVR